MVELCWNSVGSMVCSMVTSHRSHDVMVPKELHLKTKPRSPGTLAREGPGTEQWHQDGSQTRSSIRVGDQVPSQIFFSYKKPTAWMA